ncbi:MAG: porin [Bacteroidetes bacterium]|nr:MAG: porin [Bacteroidota bacterium]
MIEKPIKMIGSKYAFLLFGFLLFCAALPAQDSLRVEPDAEPVSESPNGLEISGFVDAYYQYHFQKNAFPTSFTEVHDAFTPGMANIVFAQKTGAVSFMADLAVGPRAETANGYNGTTLALIKQLFVTYAPTDNLTFTLGNFGTFIGYELIDAPANLNYSTSYLFSNGPFYHTGLKAELALSDHWGFMAGVFNDTDRKIDEVPGKHIGAQLSFSNDNLSAYLNYLGGKDDDSVADHAVFGHQWDLTASYALSDKWGLGLNATMKMVAPAGAENQYWGGVATYVNYTFSEIFTLAFRGEWVSDKDGLILDLPGDEITSLTLSGNIHAGPLCIIPEIRVDHTSRDAFSDAGEQPTDKSAAFLVGVVYAF